MVRIHINIDSTYILTHAPGVPLNWFYMTYDDILLNMSHSESSVLLKDPVQINFVMVFIQNIPLSMVYVFINCYYILPVSSDTEHKKIAKFSFQ